MLDRLRQEMFRQKINARQLAERANIGRSFVYDLLSGKSPNPTTKKIGAIADALGVSMPYLITGANENVTVNVNNDLICVPIIYGNFDSSMLQHYFFHKRWVTNNLKSIPENLRIVMVSCDSMSPHINPNDIVVVDTGIKTPIKPGIFIISNGTTFSPKRIEYVPGKEFRNVFISSDNNRHMPYMCDINEINIIGRVVWVAREVN